jgi:hypothetical protein
MDFEVFEAGGFGFFELVLDDLVDTAAAGAFFELGAEFVEVFGRAGGDEFDVAGVGVADPAAQAELGGFAMDEPAKADALNAAADEEVKNHQRVKCLVSCGARQGEVLRRF